MSTGCGSCHMSRSQKRVYSAAAVGSPVRITVLRRTQPSQAGGWRAARCTSCADALAFKCSEARGALAVLAWRVGDAPGRSLQRGALPSPSGGGGGGGGGGADLTC